MSKKNETEVRKISISFYPRDEEIVRQYSQKLGLNNFSAANRAIIREWAGMKAALPILQGQAEEAMTELQRLEQS